MKKIFTPLNIVFASIGVLFLVFFSLSFTYVFKEDIPYQQTDEVTQNEISMAHHEINNITGWGTIKSFYTNAGYDSFKNQLNNVITRIENAKKTCKNDIVKRDLIRAEKALKKGIQSKDYHGLLYAHRLLHDVNFITTFKDHAFEFADKDLKLWHVSESGGGDFSQVDRYIK